MSAVQPLSGGIIRFGVFEVDSRAGELRKQGVRIKLQDQPFQVLQLLLERPRDIVTREELRQRIWQADTFVDFDHGVYNAVQRLREALGDSAESPRFIETIARRGYRFIGPISIVAGPEMLPTNGDSGRVASKVDDSLNNLVVLRSSDQAGTLPATNGVSRRRHTAGAIAAVVVILFVIVAAFPGFGPESMRKELFGTGSPSIHSLAVLPLQNLSGDPGQEYFADGMTEELITELSQLSGLKVISRTSVMRYKNTDKSLPMIARELGVDGIVEGSVLRSGDRVRITAQLIYAPQDANLWAQTYDRDLRDVLSLQSAVARAVADEIRVKMTPGEKVRISDSHPVNPAALEAYWKGASVGYARGARYKAVQYFEEAIRIDPNFARAYVALFWAHVPNVAPPPAEVPLVKDALAKALALEPDLAEAHLALARFKEFHEWDFPGAEREFKRAIELDPNNAGFRDFYGDYLDNMGRLEEGRKQEQLAQELDPGTDHLIDGYNAHGDYSRVEEIARRQVATHPDDGTARYALALVYMRNGRYKEAAEELQRVVISFGYPEMAPPLAKAYAESGSHGLLKLWAKDLEQAQGDPACPTMVAEVYAIMGDKENTFKWLEKGYAERDGFLVALKHPAWQFLRSDPRYQDLLRRVGLSPS